MVNDWQGESQEGSPIVSRRGTLRAAGTAVALASISGCMGVIGDPNADSGSVEYWTLFGGGDGKTMASMVEQVTKEHGIPIDVQRTSDYYTRLYTSLIGNEAPDVAIIHASRMEEYSDLVEPLTDEIGTDPYLDTIVDRGVVDGEQLAVPLDAHPFGLYYNKDLFEEAGLDPEDPPNSPQKFQEAATRITKNTDGLGVQHNNLKFHTHVFYMLLSSIGGRLLTDDVEPAFDDEKGLRAARYLSSWSNEHSWLPKSQSTGWDAWIRGDCGMMIEGTWHLSVVEESDFEFGLTKPFVMPGSDTPKTWADSHMLVIPKSSSRSDRTRERAIEAIRMLTQTYNIRWGIEAGHLPASQAAYNGSKIRNSDTWKKTLHVFFEMAKNDRLAYSPTTKNNTLYQEQIYQNLQAMRRGRMSPQNTIENATAGVNEVYQ